MTHSSSAQSGCDTSSQVLDSYNISADNNAAVLFRDKSHDMTSMYVPVQAI